jgi:hypothetical protein
LLLDGRNPDTDPDPTINITNSELDVPITGSGTLKKWCIFIFYLANNIRRGGGTVEPQVGVRFLIRQGHHHRILHQREIISQKRD